MPDTVMTPDAPARWAIGDLVFEASANSTPKLDAALAKAQGELKPAAMTKTNPAFGNRKYADLADIWEAARPVLSKHGIAVTQWPVHSGDTRLHVVTRLACEGEWLMARFSMPVERPNAHGVGSAATYAKRFSLCAVLGIVGEEDDDGNDASRPSRKTRGGTGLTEDTRQEAQRMREEQDRERAAQGKPPLRKAQRTTKEWADDAIQDLNNMALLEDVNAWWERNKPDLDRLSEKAPAQFDRVSEAADSARMSLRATH